MTAWANSAVKKFDLFLRPRAERVAKAAGLPVWVALPTIVAFGALVFGLFAMYVDIAVHIDYGRDPAGLKGLFSPSHTAGIVALNGMMIGAFLALYLYPQNTDHGLRMLGRRMPFGATFAIAAGLFTMLGFPFDFVWHELFGEDVTLWSPSHLQLIGGGGLGVLGFAMLALEARKFPNYNPNRFGRGIVMAGILATPTVINVFAAELDFGIMQFQAVYGPIMVATMTALSFVFVRLMLGPGGAIASCALWIVLRGAPFLFIAALDLAEPRFYPQIAEALIVEAVFLVVSSRRPAVAAGISGVLIGTVGVVATFGFSRVWGYHVFPWDDLTRAMTLATIGAVGAAVLAVGVSRLLAKDLVPKGYPRGAWVAVAIVAVIVAYSVPLSRNGGADRYVADVTMSKTHGGRYATAEVRFKDPSVTKGVDWFDLFVYQGGDRILQPMQNIGNGVWRTPEPVPIYGEYKSIIRIADGSAMRAVPIRYPYDDFLGMPAIPVQNRYNVTFERDTKYLLREMTGDRPELMQIGYAIHGLTWVLFLAFTAWIMLAMYRDRPILTAERKAWSAGTVRTWPRMATGAGA